MIIVYEKKTGWGIIKNFSKKVFQKAKNILTLMNVSDILKVVY